MNEIERIYLILISFLGESKQGKFDSNTTQYQFNCPSCADEKGGIDNKYNLEISLALDKLQFHCWSCGISGTISKLIKSYGNKDLLKEYYSIIDSIKKSKLYDINLFSGYTESEIFKPTLELPKTFKKVDLKSCSDYRVVKYLVGRGIDQDIIDTYNIGYTSWEEKENGWKCRIIIPSYDEYGILNYYVGRDYLPENKEASFKRIKYKNCDNDKKEIIFNENLIDWNSTIYLCEGIFDSLVYKNAIPLMGKVLKSDFYLYKKLIKNAKANIVIALDGDTTEEETKDIYRLLNNSLKNKIFYINLGNNSCPYKDFSDIYENEGKEGIIRTFRLAKKYKEIDLLS